MTHPHIGDMRRAKDMKEWAKKPKITKPPVTDLLVEPCIPNSEKYIRNPVDCEKCRKEHGISKFHYGPDENADCGRCMAEATIARLRGDKR